MENNQPDTYELLTMSIDPETEAHCGLPLNIKVLADAQEERDKYNALMSQQLLAKKLKDMKDN